MFYCMSHFTCNRSLNQREVSGRSGDSWLNPLYATTGRQWTLPIHRLPISDRRALMSSLWCLIRRNSAATVYVYAYTERDHIPPWAVCYLLITDNMTSTSGHLVDRCSAIKNCEK